VSETLWNRRQIWVSGAAVAVGFALVVWSWWGASGQAALSEQHGWIALGVAGDAVVLIGSLAWLRGGRHQVSAALVAVREWLPAPVAQTPSMAPSAAVTPLPVASSDMHLYHRPDCQFSQGKPVRAATPAEHELGRRRPCPVCRP
jgi:hypothetical protein